jgi:hypothetical protein
MDSSIYLKDCDILLDIDRFRNLKMFPVIRLQFHAGTGSDVNQVSDHLHNRLTACSPSMQPERRSRFEKKTGRLFEHQRVSRCRQGAQPLGFKP